MPWGLNRAFHAKKKKKKREREREKQRNQVWASRICRVNGETLLTTGTCIVRMVWFCILGFFFFNVGCFSFSL